MRVDAKCKNLKISIRMKTPINKTLLEKKGIQFVEKRQNFNLKIAGACITFYKHTKNTLHVTGIKSKSQLTSIDYFIRSDMENTPTSYRVDNSLFSFKNATGSKHINFVSAIEQVEKSGFYGCSYTPEIFPALFLKPSASCKQAGFPTILLFSSGSVVLLGGKCLVKVDIAIQMLRNLTIE